MMCKKWQPLKISASLTLNKIKSAAVLINSTHHDSGTIEDSLWDKWKTIREHRFFKFWIFPICDWNILEIDRQITRKVTPLPAKPLITSALHLSSTLTEFGKTCYQNPHNDRQWPSYICKVKLCHFELRYRITGMTWCSVFMRIVVMASTSFVANRWVNTED